MRKNNFDFLRLFSAFTVLIMHATAHLNTSFLWVSPYSKYWVDDGVLIFFIISGFFVYRSCEKSIEENRLFKYFYLNRCLRIVPAMYTYLVIAILTLFFLGVVSGITKPFILWIASNLALVPVYSPEIFKNFGIGIINGSLWTISAEVSFYIIVPLLVIIKNKLGTLPLLAIIGVVGYVGLSFKYYISKDSIIVKLLDVSMFPYLLYFGLGICCALFWEKINHSRTLLIGAFLIYSFLRFFITPTDTLAPIWWLCCAIPLTYLIFYFGFYGPLMFSKITSRLGDLSFGLYIWHVFIINSLLYFNNHNIWLLIGLSFIIAYISWHFIENPFLNLKKYSLRKSTNNINLKTPYL